MKTLLIVSFDFWLVGYGLVESDAREHINTFGRWMPIAIFCHTPMCFSSTLFLSLLRLYGIQHAKNEYSGLDIFYICRLCFFLFTSVLKQILRAAKFLHNVEKSKSCAVVYCATLLALLCCMCSPCRLTTRGTINVSISTLAAASASDRRTQSTSRGVTKTTSCLRVARMLPITK